MSRTEKENANRARGQALIETSVGLIILVMVFVGLIAGSIDVYAYMAFSEKTKMAAQAAANAYSQQRCLYNCMLLPESEEAAANEKAHQIADYIMDQLGLPKGRTITVKQETLHGALVGRVDITVNCLLPFRNLTGLVLPGGITVTAFDAIGFSKARMARFTVPNYNEGLNGPLLTMGNYCGQDGSHLTQEVINFPIFAHSTATMSPGSATETQDPSPDMQLGEFPNGSSIADHYYPQMNLLGVGYQPGRSGPFN